MNKRTFLRVLTGSIAAALLPKIAKPRCYTLQQTQRSAAKVINFTRMYRWTETGRFAPNFHVQQANADMSRRSVHDFVTVESDFAAVERRYLAWRARIAAVPIELV